MSALRLYAGLFSPLRLYRVFRFLLTAFLIFRGQFRWLFWKPLPPEMLLDTIVRLGASFIKLAQVLATRADFFDERYLAALRKLHDELPPMSEVDFRFMYRRAFGDGSCFSAFDDVPIACASIGQVHRAKLLDGTDVAVKIRRRHIERVVQGDIRILATFLFFLRPLFSGQTRNSLEAVLQAFSRTILQEVDMAKEKANLEDFSRIYKDSGIRFPRAFPHCSSNDALVMSFENGCRFDDGEELARRGVDFREIMGKLILFYTEQMLINGFFHADPHPGNLLVGDDGGLALLDFGMVSRISNRTRIAMINAVKAAYEKDYELLIQSARNLGTISGDVPDDELSGLVAEVFRIFEDDSLSAASMQNLATSLLSTMKSQPFKLPQEIIYVLRVSSIIEGLGTTYIENFNGIKDILPVLRKNLTRALGNRNSPFAIITQEARQLPLTISRLRHVIDTLDQGELAVRLSNEERREWNRPLIAAIQNLAWTALLIAFAFYLKDAPYPHAGVLSVGCLIGAALRLLWQRR